MKFLFSHFLAASIVINVCLGLFIAYDILNDQFVCIPKFGSPVPNFPKRMTSGVSFSLTGLFFNKPYLKRGVL